MAKFSLKDFEKTKNPSSEEPSPEIRQQAEDAARAALGPHTPENMERLILPDVSPRPEILLAAEVAELNKSLKGIIASMKAGTLDIEKLETISGKIDTLINNSAQSEIKFQKTIRSALRDTGKREIAPPEIQALIVAGALGQIDSETGLHPLKKTLKDIGADHSHLAEKVSFDTAKKYINFKDHSDSYIQKFFKKRKTK